MFISNQRSEEAIAIQENKVQTRSWLWWLSGCAILVCVVLGIVAFFLFSSSNKKSYPLSGQVSFPSTVKKGDNFDFVITLKNPTTSPIFIKHIVLHQDLSAPYLLEGATVTSVEPSMQSEPFVRGNDMQYVYFRDIDPGETQTVIFHMQAKNSGIYYANVGVYAKDPEHPEPAFLHVFHFFDARVEIMP